MFKPSIQLLVVEEVVNKKDVGRQEGYDPGEAPDGFSCVLCFLFKCKKQHTSHCFGYAIKYKHPLTQEISYAVLTLILPFIVAGTFCINPKLKATQLYQSSCLSILVEKCDIQGIYLAHIIRVDLPQPDRRL